VESTAGLFCVCLGLGDWATPKFCGVVSEDGGSTRACPPLKMRVLLVKYT
jgi:hypothetical protein